MGSQFLPRGIKMSRRALWVGPLGMSRDLGRDVPDVEKFMQENFGLIFRSLEQLWETDLYTLQVLGGVVLFDNSLSGPLDRLNAILSLLQPLDRYRAPSAIGSAIGRPLSRPISHPRTGRSPQPPRSKPLRGPQPRDSGAIVPQTSLK